MHQIEPQSPPEGERPAFVGNGGTPLSRFLIRLGQFARRVGRNTLIVALVLLIAFLAVWYTAPILLCNYLNKRGASLPDYILHIQQVHIHPITCGVTLRGLRLVKRSDKIPVPFFTCPRMEVSMQWWELIHFHTVSVISLYQPVVNFVNGPTPETTQTFLEPAWVTAVKQLVPLEINRFTISDGDVHYMDFHADPQINMEMDQLQLSLDNLTNSTHSKELMPSTAYITGRPFKTGMLEAGLALNVDLKQPTFAEKVRLQNIPAVDLNAFLAKYGSVYAKSGNLAFYTEMVSAKGKFNGYAKPFFQNLQFEPMPKDRDGLAAIWASLVNGVKDLLENDDKAVATTVPISGSYSDPNVDFWSAAFGLLKNAYLQALTQDFQHPEISPAPEKQQIAPAAIQKAANQDK
jgi:hypothetical protein